MALQQATRWTLSLQGGKAAEASQLWPSSEEGASGVLESTFSHCAGAHPQLRTREATLLSSIRRDEPRPPCSVSACVGVFPEPGSVRIQCLAWSMVSNTLWPHLVPANIIVCLSAADSQFARMQSRKDSKLILLELWFVWAWSTDLEAAESPSSAFCLTF